MGDDRWWRSFDLETEERERVDAGLVPALGLQLTGRLA